MSGAHEIATAATVESSSGQLLRITWAYHLVTRHPMFWQVEVILSLGSTFRYREIDPASVKALLVDPPIETS